MVSRRHILFCLFLLVMCGFVHAQVRFARTTLDLGTIPEDTVRLPRCEFSFVNEGDTVVALSRVSTSCGCLRASYGKRPVQPGQTGYVTVTFDPAGRPGKFLRKVSVYFAGQVRPYVLQIKGTVAPARRSGQQFPSYPFRR